MLLNQIKVLKPLFFQPRETTVCDLNSDRLNLMEIEARSAVINLPIPMCIPEGEASFYFSAKRHTAPCSLTLIYEYSEFRY